MELVDRRARVREAHDREEIAEVLLLDRRKVGTERRPARLGVDAELRPSFRAREEEVADLRLYAAAKTKHREPPQRKTEVGPRCPSHAVDHEARRHLRFLLSRREARRRDCEARARSLAHDGSARALRRVLRVTARILRRLAARAGDDVDVLASLQRHGSAPASMVKDSISSALSPPITSTGSAGPAFRRKRSSTSSSAFANVPPPAGLTMTRVPSTFAVS